MKLDYDSTAGIISSTIGAIYVASPSNMYFSGTIQKYGTNLPLGLHTVGISTSIQHHEIVS